MFLVSDVHGAFSALARVAVRSDQVVVLGDLVNLIDYRTNEGIVSDVVGADIVAEVSALRGADRYDDATSLWRERTAELGVDIRREVAEGMRTQYEAMREALHGTSCVVIHGNVDDPAMLVEHLPDGCRYAHAEVIDIEGLRVGLVGGGLMKIGSRGEISDDDMADALDGLGRVDVLCTHVPPSIPMVAEDVIAGSVKGSVPVRDYLERAAPEYHYFGDVHQPRASRWRHGPTELVNVGYFRATGRGIVHPRD